MCVNLYWPPSIDQCVHESWLFPIFLDIVGWSAIVSLPSFSTLWQINIFCMYLHFINVSRSNIKQLNMYESILLISAMVRPTGKNCTFSLFLVRCTYCSELTQLDETPSLTWMRQFIRMVFKMYIVVRKMRMGVHERDKKKKRKHIRL